MARTVPGPGRPSYLPQKGDEVVVYTHKFKAENYAEGMKLIEEGFPAAQAKAGQTRRNYILTDPSNYEVILVSFFAPGSNVDEWHKFVGRSDVLKQLQPMWSEPQRVERFILEGVADVPGK
ncbi:MAG: hypothetical protein WDN31_16835 [Hyphomicrobium sp.]